DIDLAVRIGKTDLCDPDFKNKRLRPIVRTDR
ncbi:MAG: hypothetical protein ACI85S_002089, partial [Pseudohongiellaceae bacterium]